MGMSVCISWRHKKLIAAITISGLGELLLLAPWSGLEFYGRRAGLAGGFNNRLY